LRTRKLLLGGKEGGTVSTQQVYKCVNTFYATLLAELEELDLDLVSKDIILYLPDKAEFSNRKLLQFYRAVHHQKFTHNQSWKQSSDISSTQTFRCNESTRRNS
jgi:hypothetical protein